MPTKPIDIPEDADQKTLYEIANKVMFETGVPIPQYGKHKTVRWPLR